MRNPYASPESAPPPPAPRVAAGTLPFLIGLACALLAAIAPMAVVPQFRAVLDGFGATLPRASRIVMGHAGMFWILPAALTAARLWWPGRRRRAMAACLIGILGLTLTLTILALALYAPIFLMAKPV